MRNEIGGEQFNWIDTLAPTLAAQILSGASLRTYADGQRLYERRSLPTGIFRLRSGRVRMFLSNDGGKEFLLKIVRAPEILGDVACIDGRPYPVFAEAQGQVTLDFIPAAHLHKLRERHPEINQALLAQIASAQRATISVLESLAVHDITQRLAFRLVWLADAARIRGEAANTVLIAQSDLGLMIGASRQTINLELSRLEKLGIISRQNGGVTIAKPDRLRELAFRT